MNVDSQRCRRLRDEDSGSALVLALLVVLVTGLLLTAALDFTGTGLTLAPKLRNDRNSANYLQGAVDGAIESIRGSSTYGRVGTGIACPSFTPDVPTAVLGVSSHSYNVTCTAKDVGSGHSPDQPDFAIQALGSAPEGVRQSSGNDQLTITGGVYSHGVVTVNAGGGNTRNRMFVYGSVLADGACDSARITTTDPDTKPICDRNTTPTDGTYGGDPKYPSAIADDSELGTIISSEADPDRGADPVPTCAAGNGGPVSFYPGYYSERPDVLVAQLASNCTGSRWFFQAGRYYFDYSGVWNLGSPHAVTVFAGDVAAGAILGRGCDPNQDGVPDVDGVQFMFGGSSQISVTGAGGIEVCSPRPTQHFIGSPQLISMYGVNNGVSVENGAPTSTLAATPAPRSSGDYPFLQPENAQNIDGTPTTTLLIPKGKHAALQFSGFEQLPKGARVTGLKIRVVHTLLAGARAKVAVASPSHPTPGNAQTFDVPTACTYATPCDIAIPLANVTSAPSWRDINKLALTYTASTPNSNSVDGSAAVDGVALVVDYMSPTLRTLNCGSATCTFFNSTVNLNVFVHGTVYTPSSSWAVQVQSNSGTIFDRGVIVRNIDISVSASSKQQTSPFQLPKGTPDGRLVLFKGYVDHQADETIRACVLYDDRNGLPGYGLSVSHWALLRVPASQDPDCR